MLIMIANMYIIYDFHLTQCKIYTIKNVLVIILRDVYVVHLSIYI